MNNLKKYLALLTALLLALSLAACVTVEEEPTDPPAVQSEATTEASTEAPTEAATEEATEATEETTEATEEGLDYTAYKGKWYSGSVTLNIENEYKWNMEQNGEVFITGSLVVNEEDGSLQLYDVEGTEAAKLLMDSEKSLYAELYTEELYNCLEDFFFSREWTGGQSAVEENLGGDEAEAPSEEVVQDEETDPAISDGE